MASCCGPAASEMSREEEKRAPSVTRALAHHMCALRRWDVRVAEAPSSHGEYALDV